MKNTPDKWYLTKIKVITTRILNHNEENTSYNTRRNDSFHVFFSFSLCILIHSVFPPCWTIVRACYTAPFTVVSLILIFFLSLSPPAKNICKLSKMNGAYRTKWFSIWMLSYSCNSTKLFANIQWWAANICMFNGYLKVIDANAMGNTRKYVRWLLQWLVRLWSRAKLDRKLLNLFVDFLLW